MGFGYLLLIETNNTNIEEEYYLVDANWLKLENSKKHSFQSVDSLLNGNVSSTNVEGLIPIKKELLDLYAVSDICDLMKKVFDKDGIYHPPLFHTSGKLILASLVQRGAIIIVEDFDGTPLLDIKSIGCNQ